MKGVTACLQSRAAFGGVDGKVAAIGDAVGGISKDAEPIAAEIDVISDVASSVDDDAAVSDGEVDTAAFALILSNEGQVESLEGGVIGIQDGAESCCCCFASNGGESIGSPTSFDIEMFICFRKGLNYRPSIKVRKRTLFHFLFCCCC